MLSELLIRISPDRRAPPFSQIPAPETNRPSPFPAPGLPDTRSYAPSRRPGHMAIQLNVTFCDVSCSWLTHADPPMRSRVMREGAAVIGAELGDLCGPSSVWSALRAATRDGVTNEKKDKPEPGAERRAAAIVRYHGRTGCAGAGGRRGGRGRVGELRAEDVLADLAWRGAGEAAGEQPAGGDLAVGALTAAELAEFPISRG